MSLGLVYEGLVIDSLKCLHLVLHGLLWDFPNMNATQEGKFSDISDILWYYIPLG